jgi:hypothetical protein
MPERQSPDLIAFLRETIEHLGRYQELTPDDLILLGLKREILRAIAELKIAREGRPMRA